MKSLFVLFLFLLGTQTGLGYDTSTLKLVHVVFRHGSRYPEAICQSYWAGDNSSYWPSGIGELTDLGKKEVHNIGISLRNRYQSWLNDTYYPDLISPRSTDVPRTKMSLILMLAGLFPPNEKQVWNWAIAWQPIPITHIPRATDQLMGYVPYICPNFMQALKEVYNSTEIINLVNSMQPIFNFIAHNSKRVVPQIFDNAVFLAGCIISWKEFNKTIPNWMNLIYPSLVAQATKTYIINTFNPDVTKLSGGQLLGKILNDSDSKINGTIPNRKMFIYSGHEYNIAFLLRAMKSFTLHIPPYAAHIIVELHQINQVYGFKIFYQKYDGPDPAPVIIPGCTEFCPIDQVKKLLAENIPPASLTC